MLIGILLLTVVAMALMIAVARALNKYFRDCDELDRGR